MSTLVENARFQGATFQFGGNAMNTANRMKGRACVLAAALIVALVGGAIAEDKSATASPSPEARQQMAEAHEQMAACLRSDKPFEECRSQMQQLHKRCVAAMGAQGCPMWGGRYAGLSDEGARNAPSRRSAFIRTVIRARSPERSV
jgi:hypothetical protein